MAKVKVRYLVGKPGRRLSDGSRETRWFWQPSMALRADGWAPRRLLDADGNPITDELAAALAAQTINEDLDAVRLGARPAPAKPKARAGGRRAPTLSDVIVLYKASPKFTKLADKTRRDYRYNLKIIEEWAGDAPIRALTRALVQAFYASMYDATPAKANAVIRILRVVLKFAWDNDFVDRNVAEKPGLVGTAPRLRIWTDDELDAAIAAADAKGRSSIGHAILAGYYLGQRRGDLLALRWIDYQDGRIRLRQSKRRARVDIMVPPRLAERFDQARDAGGDSPQIITFENTGRRYREDTFCHEFAGVRTAAINACPSIADAWFMDLRDTAVTTQALAGSTIPEICSITGHSEQSATAVLKHYLSLTGEMADNAIAKLLAYEERRRNETGTKVGLSNS